MLHTSNALRTTELIEVDDGDNRYATACRAARLEIRHWFESEIQGGGASFLDRTLLASDDEIRIIADDFADNCAGSVILDVSSFPKRYFFAFLKRLLRSPKVQDLVVTYTQPDTYGGVPLSEEVRSIATLPLFGAPPSNNQPAAIVVGLGFQPLGLTEILDLHITPHVRPLAPIPQSQRDRQLLLELLVVALPPGKRTQPPHYVSPLNVSETFETLRVWSHDFSRELCLAPFGPKPISIGMALAAIRGGWPVYFTQPTVYRPDYSSGVRVTSAGPAVFGYGIRLSGRDVYDSTPMS